MLAVVHSGVPLRAEAPPHPSGRRPLPEVTTEDGWATGRTTSGEHGHAEQPRKAGLPAELVGVKVLVVDDDEATLTYFATALRMCGATVVVAASAREALKMLVRSVPDAILTDIAMPDQDGYWLLQQIRRHADGGVRGVPVLAATAYAREHSRSRALAAGFKDHLQKPLDPEVLCRAMARAVGR